MTCVKFAVKSTLALLSELKPKVQVNGNVVPEPRRNESTTIHLSREALVTAGTLELLHCQQRLLIQMACCCFSAVYSHFGFELTQHADDDQARHLEAITRPARQPIKAQVLNPKP